MLLDVVTTSAFHFRVLQRRVHDRWSPLKCCFLSLQRCSKCGYEAELNSRTRIISGVQLPYSMRKCFGASINSIGSRSVSIIINWIFQLNVNSYLVVLLLYSFHKSSTTSILPLPLCSEYFRIQVHRTIFMNFPSCNNFTCQTYISGNGYTTATPIQTSFGYIHRKCALAKPAGASLRLIVFSFFIPSSNALPTY